MLITIIIITAIGGCCILGICGLALWWFVQKYFCSYEPKPVSETTLTEQIDTELVDLRLSLKEDAEPELVSAETFPLLFSNQTDEERAVVPIHPVEPTLPVAYFANRHIKRVWRQSYKWQENPIDAREREKIYKLYSSFWHIFGRILTSRNPFVRFMQTPWTFLFYFLGRYVYIAPWYAFLSVQAQHFSRKIESMRALQRNDPAIEKHMPKLEKIYGDIKILLQNFENTKVEALASWGILERGWLYMSVQELISSDATAHPGLAQDLFILNSTTDEQRFLLCNRHDSLKKIFWQYFCRGLVRDLEVYERITAILPWHPYDRIISKCFAADCVYDFSKIASFNFQKSKMRHIYSVDQKLSKNTEKRDIYPFSWIDAQESSHRSFSYQTSFLFLTHASDWIWRALQEQTWEDAWWFVIHSVKQSVIENRNWVSSGKEETILEQAEAKKVIGDVGVLILYEWIRLLRFPLPEDIMNLPLITTRLVKIFHYLQYDFIRDIEARENYAYKHPHRDLSSTYFALWSIIGDLIVIMVQHQVEAHLIVDILDKVPSVQQAELQDLYYFISPSSPKFPGGSRRGRFLTKYWLAPQRPQAVLAVWQTRLPPYLLAQTQYYVYRLPVLEEEATAWPLYSKLEGDSSILLPDIWNISLGQIIACFQQGLEYQKHLESDQPRVNPYDTSFWQDVHQQWISVIDQRFYAKPGHHTFLFLQKKTTTMARMLIKLFTAIWPFIMSAGKVVYHTKINRILKWLWQEVLQDYLKQRHMAGSQLCSKYYTGAVYVYELIELLCSLHHSVLHACSNMDERVVTGYSFAPYWVSAMPWPIYSFTPIREEDSFHDLPTFRLEAIMEWYLCLADAYTVPTLKAGQYYHYALTRLYTRCHFIPYPACMIRPDDLLLPWWALPENTLWPFERLHEIVWDSAIWQESLSFLNKAYLTALVERKSEIAVSSAINSGLIYTVLFQHGVKIHAEASIIQAYAEEALRWFDRVGFHPIVEYYREELRAAQEGENYRLSNPARDPVVTIQRFTDLLEQPSHRDLGCAFKISLLNATCISMNASVTALFPILKKQYTLIVPPTLSSDMHQYVVKSTAAMIMYWLYYGAQEGHDLLGNCPIFYDTWITMLTLYRKPVNKLCLFVINLFGQHAADCATVDPERSHYYRILTVYYWMYMSDDFRKKHINNQKAWISEKIGMRQQLDNAPLETLLRERLASLFNPKVSSLYAALLSSHSAVPVAL